MGERIFERRNRIPNASPVFSGENNRRAWGARLAAIKTEFGISERDIIVYTENKGLEVVLEMTGVRGEVLAKRLETMHPIKQASIFSLMASLPVDYADIIKPQIPKKPL